MHNFIPDCYTVIYTPDGKCLIDNSAEQDKNYLFLKELYESNVDNDLNKYIELYSQYINDKNIYNFHTYSDHPPSCCTRVFYPGCTCENKNEDSLVKIHRDRYEQSCNCVGGKRYLALRNAYEIELKKQFNEKSSLFGFSIIELFKFFKCDYNSFNKSDIIKYIESTGDVDLQYIEWKYSNK